MVTLIFFSECIQTDPCAGPGMAPDGHVQSCYWGSGTEEGVAEHEV